MDSFNKYFLNLNTQSNSQFTNAVIKNLQKNIEAKNDKTLDIKKQDDFSLWFDYIYYDELNPTVFEHIFFTKKFPLLINNKIDTVKNLQIG